MKTYHSKNFHKYTYCLWKEVSQAAFDLELPQFKSKSGSEYFFTEVGVYRISNHWGRAANCRWKLIPLSEYKNQHIKIGFAKWTDFYPNDEMANLFFIQVDFEQVTVDFFHKDIPFYDGKAILRNASETAKKIKTIKQILNEEDWAKYLKFESLETLRINLVNELIFTNSTFNELKKKYF
jgi:hypothetical protein